MADQEEETLRDAAELDEPRADELLGEAVEMLRRAAELAEPRADDLLGVAAGEAKRLALEAAERAGAARLLLRVAARLRAAWFHARGRGEFLDGRGANHDEPPAVEPEAQPARRAGVARAE